METPKHADDTAISGSMNICLYDPNGKSTER